MLNTCADISTVEDDAASWASRTRAVVTVVDGTSLRSSPQKGSCVLLVPDPPDDSLLNAIKQGVRGIVTESTAEEDLAHAVRATAMGVGFISGTAARHLLDWLANRMPEHTDGRRKAMDRLSHREREVLRLLGAAQSNADIARTLRISEATVRSHVYHILTKLDLESRTQAVLFGHQYTLASAEANQLT